LLLLLLLAFALRVVALDRLGLAYDEAASALMARATAQEIIDFHWKAAFEHPPLWALLLRVWSQLAGQSEFALRLLPAFAGTLMVVMLWRLVRLIWPHETMLPFLSGLLVALAPVLVYYSQEARMYTLVVLLFLLSTYLIMRLRLQPSWGLVLGFWLASWLMLGLHYYAALGLAIQAAVIGLDGLLVGPIRRLPWGKLITAYMGALLPVLVWMLFAPGFQTTLEVVLDKAGETPVTWQYFLGDLWRELSFGSIRWQPEYAVWGYAVAPFVAVGVLLAAPRPGRATAARLGAWLIIAIVLLPILSGTLVLRTLVPRYILWVVPLFYTLAALPAALLWRRQWLVGLVMALILVGIDLLALQYYFGPYRKSDYRAMTTYLQSRGDPQREILLLEAPRQHLLTKYYLADMWEAHPMPTLPLPAYWPVTAPLIVPEDEDDRIQGWFAAHEGLWVSYTSEAEVDRGEFLAKYLTAVSYREECSQWLDVRLCHYVSPRHLAPVTLPFTPALFANEFALSSASASFYHPTPETTSLLIQLDWHAQQKPTSDYKLSLRLLTEDGGVLDKADDYPIGPLLPPTTWNANDRKPGYFVLRVPADLPAGRYPIQISLYDANTLSPTPATPLSDPSSTDAPTTQPLTLAELQVGDTMEPMELHSPTVQ
jgi:hypothetical protein